jgi:regulator of sirC expression with transglutaminase-like and TPR domain
MSFAFERSTPRASELLRAALIAEPQRLDWAALAIAALDDGAADLAALELSLDALASRVREARSGEGIDSGLAALQKVLGEEEGFRGHPRPAKAEDSFIDAVLRTKRGLPITLGVLYVEVARRAGIPLYGISFPGQFLGGCYAGLAKRVLNPIDGGKVLGAEEIHALLRKFAPRMQLSEALLMPASVAAIATRMLANLKALYLEKGEGERALRVVDHLLILSPDHPGELRTRAALLSALGAYRAALADVERCLTLGPQSLDASNLAQAAKALRQRVEMLN